MSPGAWGWDVSQGRGRSQENPSDRSAEPVATSVTKMKHLLPTFAASFAGSEWSWEEHEKMTSTCQEAAALLWRLKCHVSSLPHTYCSLLTTERSSWWGCCPADWINDSPFQGLPTHYVMCSRGSTLETMDPHSLLIAGPECWEKAGAHQGSRLSLPQRSEPGRVFWWGKGKRGKEREKGESRVKPQRKGTRGHIKALVSLIGGSLCHHLHPTSYLSLVTFTLFTFNPTLSPQTPDFEPTLSMFA